MTPIDVATGGYLNGPLCTATDGYICVTVVVQKTGGRGQGLTKRQKMMRLEQLNKSYIMEQLVREDEELIAIIVASVDHLNGF